MGLKTYIRKCFPDIIVSSIKALISPPTKYVLKYKPTYNEDGLYTNHNSDFMIDPLFKQAYDLGFATGSSKGWHLHWRIYIACWLAYRAKDMGGDFVECGTNKGMVARAVIHYTNFGNLNKSFYLLDTFSGMSEKYQSEAEEKNPCCNIKYEPCYEEVKRTFSEFNNVIIIRGTIPETLCQVQTNKVSFIHIDMNCAEPEIAAGEYFWEKLISAGSILLDDYAYPGYIEQKHAWDDFAKQKGVQVLTIPTGQGLILKP